MPKFKRVKYNPVDYPNYNIAIPVINPQGTNIDDDNVTGYNAAYRTYLRDKEEVERLRWQRDQILEKYNKLSLQKKKEDQALQEELNDNRNSNKYKIYYR